LLVDFLAGIFAAANQSSGPQLCCEMFLYENVGAAAKIHAKPIFDNLWMAFR
jgi:hypothetical protein